jgi:hypothetical protein
MTAYRYIYDEDDRPPTVEEVQGSIIELALGVSKVDPADMRAGLMVGNPKDVDAAMKTLSCLIDLGHGLDESLSLREEMEKDIINN